jgi:hypothetical protein
VGRIQESLALISVATAVGGALAEAPQAEAQSVAQGAGAVTVAHEASAQNDWIHYGAEPLFPGGVHTKAEFKHDVLTSRGQIALADLGLTHTEVKAADTDASEGKETLKHFPFGAHFLKMTYGVNGVAVDNQGANFEDTTHPHGFDAYVLDVKTVTHKKVEEKVDGKEVAAEATITTDDVIAAPTVCVNISLVSEKTTETIVPLKPIKAPVKTPAPKPAPTPETPSPVVICSNVNSPNAGGNCNTTTPLPTPVVTPPAPVGPTITFEAAPPAQEQYTDGYTYQDNADVTYPAGDQVLVTFGTTNANEGSASSAFQPDATDSPQKWSTEVSMASGDYLDPNFGVIGTITDETTGLSATVTDVMGTQAMPSLGQ